MSTIDPTAVLWRDAVGGREGSHLLIVMHGYGSHEGDLYGLAPLIPDNITIAALRAPITMAPGNSFMPGSYAWFPILGENPDPTIIDSPVAAVLEWLDTLPETYASIGLMGFSQGGAMSVQLARTAPERFSYLLQLSGFVNPAPHQGDEVLKAKDPRIPAFQAWGTLDDIVGEERSTHATEWMSEHFALESHSYPMPHSITQEEMGDIVDFITRVTS